jgi:hypothetical protein
LERTINSASSPFVDGSTVATGWVLSAPGSSLELDVLAGPGHAGPAHTLIGKPDPSNPTEYTNANGSIAGNGSHNPFLANTITFTINFPGVTAASTISNVILQFGTTDGSNQVPGTPVSSVPEPASLVMAGFGLATALGCCILQRRRNRPRAA